MLRISVRASRTTSRRTPRSNQRRAVHPVYAAHRRPAHWTGICSIHSLTRYISTDENVLPGSRWHRAPRAGFRHLHRASRGDRFPSPPGESGASGGSATSDRWWSAPHGYAAHLLPPVTDASYRIVHRIKNSPDFVFGQPFSGIRERHLRSVCRKYRQRLPLTAGQYQFRPGSGQSLNGGGRERRQYAAVTVDKKRRQPGASSRT